MNCEGEKELERKAGDVATSPKLSRCTLIVVSNLKGVFTHLDGIILGIFSAMYLDYN